MKTNTVYRPIVVPLLIFSVITAVSALFWRQAQRHTDEIIKTKVKLTTDLAADRLQRYFDERIRYADTIRKNLIRGHISTLDEFTSEAREAIEVLKGYQAINWVDPEGIIRWIYPEEGNLPARDMNLRTHEFVGSVLREVDQTGNIGASPPVELKQGGFGFAIYLPIIRHDGANGGYVNAVFRFAPVLETCFKGRIAEDFWYSVRKGTELIFDSPHAPDNLEFGKWVPRSIQVAGNTWNVELIPKPQTLSLVETRSDEFVFLLGLALALSLCLLSYRFLQGRELLRERTRELQAVYEAYPDLQFLVAVDGTILNYQASEKTKLYRPPEEFLGKRMQDVLPPEVGARFGAALDELRDGATMAVLEYALEQPEGRQFYESRILPISKTELIIIDRNITRQHQSDLKLRQSEEKYRQIVDTAREGIWVLDLEAKTTFVNQRMAELLGYTAAEMLDRPIFDFMGAEHRQQLEAEFNSCRQGIKNHHEIQFQHQDGTPVWTTMACNPLENEQNESMGTLGMVSDVGEPRRIALALQQLAEDVSGIEAESFFDSIVLRIAEAVGVDYAFIGLLDKSDPADLSIETLAACHGGKIIENFKYSLAGTPCQNVLGQEMCIYPEAVTTAFPEDDDLAEMGIESYAGMPLVDSSGHAFGLLVLLHSAKLPRVDTIQHLLKIFAVRSAAELERLQTQRQLQQSKERLGIVVDNLPGVVYSYTRHADGRRTSTYLSPGLAELIGTTSDVDALWHEDDRFEELIHPVDRKRLTEYRSQLRGTGKIIDFECRVRSDNGDYRWIRSLGRPVPKSNGDVQWHGILLDINQRKRAEREIERERRLFMGGPVAVVRWSAQPGGPVDYISANVATLFGYDATEFTDGKRTYLSLIHPDDLDRINQEILDYIAIDQASFDQKYRIIRADGAIRHVYDYTIIERDDEGKITHYDGYVLDITDLQEANAALQESEERFRTVVTNAQPIIFAIDKNGIFTLSEGLSLSALGLKPGEAVGRSALEMYQDFPALVEGLRAALVGNSYRDEIEVDGFHFDIVISPLIEAGGKVTGAMGMAIDITEHKRAEIARSETESKLRNVVENSTNMFFSHTLERVLTYVSPQTREILDCTPEEAIAHWPNFVTDNPANQRGHDLTRKALETGARQEPYELELVTLQGRKVWVDVREAPLVENGQTVGMVGSLTDITERKKAEQTLAESQQRFDLHIKHTPLGVIEWDLNFEVINWNPSAEQIFGFTAEEAKGRNSAGLILPENVKDQVQKVWNDLLSQSGGHRSTNENLTKTGETILCEWYNTPLVNNEGKVLGVASLVQDITERRRTEEALLSEKELSEDYINSLPGLFYVFDEERFVRWNETWHEVTGYTKEDLATKYGTDFFDGEDQPLIAERMQQVFRDGATEVEAELVTKDGRRIPYYFTGIRRNFNGKPHLVGLGIDISERKHAEEALRESETRFRAITNQSSEGIAVADIDGHYTSVNPAFCKMIGYSEEELLQMTVFDVKARAQDISSFARSKTSAEGIPIQVLLQRKDGTEFISEVVGKVIVIDGKECVLGTIHDITERKRAEEALRDSEKRFRTMTEHAPEAILVLDTDTRHFTDVNENACRMFKYDRKRLLKLNPMNLSPERLKDGRLAAPVIKTYLERALKGETPVIEWNHFDSELREFPCEVRLVRLPATGRNLIRATVTDISERKEVERRQAVMVDELDHRVKNNLAAVLALSTQTLASSASLEEFGTVFAGRIEALARTHEVLAASKWQGAWINDVVRLVLSPTMLPEGTNISFAGKNLMLSARAASPITMTLHELLTNSLKHGSLSTPNGKLRVEWTVTPKKRLEIEWQEFDGPKITEPPQAGLGLTLIRGFIEHELDGRTNLDFKPDGLICQLSIPLTDEDSTID